MWLLCFTKNLTEKIEKMLDINKFHGLRYLRIFCGFWAPLIKIYL